MLHTTSFQDKPGIADDIGSAIKEMRKEKGNTCISIIVPTHRSGQDRQADSKEVQRAILTAKESVANKSDKDIFEIDGLLDQIDFTRNKDGIGIFISRHIKKLIKFPFPVTRKIIVNKRFHLQDLLYLESYSDAYYLFDISKKEIRLFRGVMDHLEEIKDENFPKEIIDDYEYNRPSQSSSNAGYAHSKGFEKDKSEIQHIRLKKILSEIDRCLSKYLVRKEVPLLLCGPQREISLFKSVTNHLDNIAGSIPDNQQRTGMHDMEVSAWSEIKSFIDQQKLKLVDEFKEKIGAGLAVYGLENVWKAANEGKGFKLLVEEGYSGTVFNIQGEVSVNEIMDTILEKNGKIIIVGEDDLKDHKRIALINRY
jgi:peptide subunit release factor 1 (eRF1)